MSLRIRLSDPQGHTRWVSVFPDAAAAARHAADLVEETLRAEPGANLILPAGGTPVPIFRELVRRSDQEELDLSQAHLFQLDEVEGVNVDDQRSFHAFLRRSLLDELDRSEKLDHLLDGCASDPAQEIEHHAARLAELGGAQLSLLGLGINGHIGYNEPGSLREDAARRVELGESTIDSLRPLFRDRPVPVRGITLGVKEIRASRRICVVVTGASKAEILARILYSEPCAELPATWLADHPDIHWIVDQPAAAKLEQTSSTTG